MITRKSTFFFGLVIFLLPFVGLPTFWRVIFYVVIGLTLIVMSIDFSFHKKISRPKHRKEKEKVVEHVYESIPLYTRDNILDQSEIHSIQTPEVKPVKKRAPRRIKITE